MKQNRFLNRQRALVVARVLAVPALIGSAAPAFAAFTAPAAQGFEDLMGTSGANGTGVWELQNVITVAGVAIVLLTITMVGIVFARKVVRKFTG